MFHYCARPREKSLWNSPFSSNWKRPSRSVVTCTVNSLTCSDCSSMADTHLRPTTFSWEITSTAASNHSKLLFFCSPTKLSSRKISSSFVETTSAGRLIESMDSTMNARIGTQSASGKSSKMFLTACPLPH